MDITINTPALLFPAISLIMLAYTNRFLALASVARNLHDKYQKGEKDKLIHTQIKILKYRLKLIKNMQAFGVMSFLSCIFCMFFIYNDNINWANFTFGLGILSLIISLVISFIEIQQSTRAIELELSDMEGLEDPTIIEYIRKKLDMGD